MTLRELIFLARIGAEWEHGNAVRMPEPAAQERVRKMEVKRDELDCLLDKLPGKRGRLDAWSVVMGGAK